MPAHEPIKIEIEDDEEVLRSKLVFAEKLFPYNGVMLCPVSHSRSRYFSANCEHVLGHTYAELRRMDVADFFGLIHPEDLPLVQQCMEFMRNLRSGDPEDTRFAMQYRMRDSGGEFHYMKDEKIAIRTTGNNYLYLMLFSNLSQEGKFSHVKLEVHQRSKNNFLHTYTYNPQQPGQDITPRQNDIVQLVVKGFTNQEIADRLRLSLHTVKNHKQMLFKKMNVKSSMELAHRVREVE